MYAFTFFYSLAALKNCIQFNWDIVRLAELWNSLKFRWLMQWKFVTFSFLHRLRLKSFRNRLNINHYMNFFNWSIKVSVNRMFMSRWVIKRLEAFIICRDLWMCFEKCRKIKMSELIFLLLQRRLKFWAAWRSNGCH